MPFGDRNRTINSIIVYLLLTLALSSIFYVLIARHPMDKPGGQGYVFALMWCPGIAGLLTRLIFQGNLRGHGFGWGKTKYQFASYWIPLAYASAVYLPIWFAGYFDANSPMLARFTERVPTLPHAFAFLVLFLVLATVGVLSSCVSTLGEELGWRGFLVPELAKVTSYSRVSFISGAAWALWHYPVILFGGYHAGAPLWYSMLCFTILVFGASFLFAWMRLKSGSLWTGVILHASHNLFIQAFFDMFTRPSRVKAYWTSEFGAGLALVLVVVALICYRKRAELPVPS